jgi:hypothetical protein
MVPGKKRKKKKKKKKKLKVRLPLPEKPPKTEKPDNVYDRKKSKKELKKFLKDIED